MSDCTILVCGFDSWRVMWKGWCHFHNKYWPDCPWPVRFMTNRLDPPCGEAIRCGPSTDWTTMMLTALTEIKTDITLFTLADYWLTQPVDTKTLMEFASYIPKYGVGHLRLQRSDPITQQARGAFEPDPRLFVFEDHASYRISLQAALWRTVTFAALLQPYENPWHFETNASVRSAGMVNCLCVNSDTTPNQWNHMAYLCYHNIVSGGQWCGQPVDDRLEPMVDDFIERYG